jgi:hypothetical protein
VWGTVVGWRYDLLVLLSVACSVGALALAAGLARRLWAPGPALLVLAVLAVNPPLLLMAGMISSEPPFMLLSLAALVLAESQARRPILGAGAAAVMGALVRTAGVTVIGALGLDWLLRRRWRAATVLAIAAAVTVGAWTAWTVLAPTQHIGTTYIADLTSVEASGNEESGGPAAEANEPGPVGTLFSRVADNVPQYLAVTIPLALPLPTVPGTPLDNLAIAGLVTIGLAFGIVVLWRRWRVGAIYLLAYCAMLAVWPWRHSRFLVPILPLVVLAVWWGLASLVRAIRPRWESAAVVGLAVLVLATGVTQAVPQAARWRGCPHGRPVPEGTCLSGDHQGFFAALRFVSAETPNDATFVTSKSPELFWYTGRRSVRREDAMAQAPEAFADYLREAGVDYVLLASVHAVDFDRLPARLRPHCDRLRVAFSAPPSTFVLALAPDSAPADSVACRALAVHRGANLNRAF